MVRRAAESILPAMKHPGLAESKIVVSGNRGIKIVKSVFVRQSASALYAFWRDLSNLTKIVQPPVEVSPVSAVEAHWTVSVPGGERVAWDTLIINEEPGRLIAWRSGDNAGVPNAGTVRFEPLPGGKGTEVTVKLEYDPPDSQAEEIGVRFSRDEAGERVADALQRFKTLFDVNDGARIPGASWR